MALTLTIKKGGVTTEKKITKFQEENGHLRIWFKTTENKTTETEDGTWKEVRSGLLGQEVLIPKKGQTITITSEKTVLLVMSNK